MSTVQVQPASNNLVERVKRLLISPATEWDVIDGEKAETSTLLAGYVLPLAGISAAAGFVGSAIIGQSLPLVGYYRVSIPLALTAAVFTLCMAVVTVFVISFIVNTLAPTFAAQKDSGQALKVAVYTYTPAWVAGVAQLLPFGSSLFLIAGAFYSIYLLYLGLPRLMKSPADKAIAYTATVIVCAIVLSIVIAVMSAVVVGTGAVGAGLFGGGASSAPAASITFDPDSPLGKLEQLGKGLEESGRKIEAAEKSGDQGAQVAAALEG
jgi:hypothetical protein